MKSPVTAIIIVKNEQDLIVKAIESCRWCDEIIVADDGSADETRQRVKKLAVTLHTLSPITSFAAKRNQCLQFAHHDWVLFVDADEQISHALASEISTTIQNTDCDGFSIPRRDFIFGKQLQFGETGHMQLLRLAKKQAGTWKRDVHEVWDIQGKVGTLRNIMTHSPHENIEEFIQSINLYTEIEASQRFQAKPSLITLSFQMLFFPIGKFVYNSVILLGILDGFAGIVHAYMMSLHSLAVRIKVIEKLRNTQ